MTLRTWASGAVDPLGADVRATVVVACLVLLGLALLWAFVLVSAQEDDPERLYIADRSLSPVFNGSAVAGEQISVLTLLAVPGGIALFGYDGYLYAIDILVAFGVLLLLAQKIRNSGRYTLGGLFSLRASGAAPRVAASLVTLIVTIPILAIQLRAAGITTAFLVGMSTPGAQIVCTVLMAFLVACFAGVADLRGLGFMHVIKVPLALVTLAVVSFLALKQFEWDPGSVLSAAVNKSAAPQQYLSGGIWSDATTLGAFNLIGDHLVVILGTAVAPHLILRISASRTGRSARRSMSTAVGLSGVYTVLLIATGFAAAAVVGSGAISAVDADGQSSPILLASAVLPDHPTARIVLVTVMACLVFLSVLTTVASVAFAAAVSFAHDVYAKASRAERSGTGEVWALRLAVAVLCAAALSVSAATVHHPFEFLMTFSMSVAASCIFPVLIYSFFWRRFNRTGLLWCVYGGLSACVVLMACSSFVSGTDYALFPQAGFNWYPFLTPGLISVPTAFLLGWLGSRRSPGQSEAEFRRDEYKLLTGEDARPRGR
ncbi:transporter [Streptomyces sp. NPDC006197]|uniref:sodium:solute symporter family transporter n=1 Tax=Streptomyces sp. NPDC006197 TaxID=3156685 RepID=UPI0033B33A93